MSNRTALTVEQIDNAFKRSYGYCKHCWKRLSRFKRGRLSGRGAHEIDHSRAWARGGSNHGNNLLAICAVCNVEKSDGPSSTFHRLKADARKYRHERRSNYHAAKALIPGIFAGVATTLLISNKINDDGATVTNMNHREPAKPNLWPLYIGGSLFLILFLVGMNQYRRA